MRILITGRRSDARSAMRIFLQSKLASDDVVAEAADLQTLLTQAEATQPDVILLDRELCDQPLEQLIPALQLLESQPGVILINARPETQPAAIAVGVDPIVLTGEPPKRLLIAIESVRLEREGN